ncbi:MAG: hypothetical protein C4560_03040 [Nitrospiraceae bacterium]|nr:MAG: hypothetical protein C4560_03040 [Nitrospiraceae bacterium]
MTPYEKAYSETMHIEGLYSDDPNDFGGETYKGIARKKNPDWHGWAFIDEAKTKPGFPESLKNNALIEELVKDFYKAHFWNLVWGDRVSDLSCDVAAEMFDTAVNQGPYWAVVYLQQSLNLLNRNATLYPDLVVDGVIGQKSISALQTYLRRDPAQMLLLWMNIMQGARYAEIMKKSPTQEGYARGWAKRIKLIKS